MRPIKLFYDWLNEPPRNERERWLLIFKTLALQLILMVVLSQLLTSLMSSKAGPDTTGTTAVIQENVLVTTRHLEMFRSHPVLLLIGIPVVLEFLCRLLPLGIAIWLFGRSVHTRVLLILIPPFLGVSLTPFFVASSHQATVHIVSMLSFSGIIYGYLFLKVCGMRPGSLIQAYLTTTVTHILALATTVAYALLVHQHLA